MLAAIAEQPETHAYVWIAALPTQPVPESGTSQVRLQALIGALELSLQAADRLPGVAVKARMFHEATKYVLVDEAGEDPKILMGAGPPYGFAIGEQNPEIEPLPYTIYSALKPIPLTRDIPVTAVVARDALAAIGDLAVDHADRRSRMLASRWRLTGSTTTCEERSTNGTRAGSHRRRETGRAQPRRSSMTGARASTPATPWITGTIWMWLMP